jgi:DNA-binding MarR family transcriptional regulator
MIDGRGIRMTTVTDNTIAYRLLEAFMQFRRSNRRPGQIAGLTPGEMMILSCVQRSTAYDPAGIKVSKISDLLNVASPTITQQINSLEAQGLVERTMDKEDRRVVRVRLTVKGESVLKKASEAFLARFSGLVEYLGEEQSNQLVDLLSKVFAYFDQVQETDL